MSSGYVHLETILLLDDKEAARLSDWIVGYYHCKQCNAFQAFSCKLPPVGSTQQEVPKMTNERNSFWRQHHHGDGRILLFERDVETCFVEKN